MLKGDCVPNSVPAEYEVAPEILTLEQEGNTHAYTVLLSVSSRMLLLLAKYLKSSFGCFGTWTQRDYLRREVQHSLSTLDTNGSHILHMCWVRPSENRLCA